MRESYKYYYIERIMDVATKNSLHEYTFNKLEEMSENDLITLWDTFRWNYVDLSEKSKMSVLTPTKRRCFNNGRQYKNL